MCMVTPMMARYWQDVLYSQLSLPVPLVQGKGICESCLQRLRTCVGAVQLTKLYPLQFQRDTSPNTLGGGPTTSPGNSLKMLILGLATQTISSLYGCLAICSQPTGCYSPIGETSYPLCWRGKKKISVILLP